MHHIHRTPIRRRLAAAVSGLTMIGVLVAVPPAGADSAYIMEPGESITVPWGSCSAPQVPTVTPPTAGTATYNSDTTVTFTASQNFGGQAVVTFTCGGLPAMLPLTFQVEQGAASAAATFTPRPAPGPCITVVLNDMGVSGIPSSIRFGDVTVGETKTSPTTVSVGSCATIDQGITARISDATSGSGENRVTWTPNSGALSPNQFSFALDVAGPLDPVALTKTATAIATLVPVGLFTASSTLAVASGSTTGIGQQFTATLGFIAVKA